ncbi:uncharacterized protein SETTUDRAFT_57081, partial [Exserohilum turcica Et28A]
LQQVLGKQDVGFRSIEQEQALYAVLDKQTPLVVVLPTGGGKSLLFTLPACIEESGVTVVVVPYRALIEDLVVQVSSYGVDCIEWKHGENNPASVVFVSADVVGDVTSNGNFLGMLVRNATYIRASTTRPNARYFVSWCQRGKLEDTALVVCKRWAEKLGQCGQKGVVY